MRHTKKKKTRKEWKRDENDVLRWYSWVLLRYDWNWFKNKIFQFRFTLVWLIVDSSWYWELRNSCQYLKLISVKSFKCKNTNRAQLEITCDVQNMEYNCISDFDRYFINKLELWAPSSMVHLTSHHDLFHAKTSTKKTKDRT